jgi:hypothetical protein
VVFAAAVAATFWQRCTHSTLDIPHLSAFISGGRKALPPGVEDVGCAGLPRLVPPCLAICALLSRGEIQCLFRHHQLQQVLAEDLMSASR